MRHLIYILLLLTLITCTPDALVTDVPGIDVCLPVRVVSEIEPGHFADTLGIWETRDDVQQWLQPVFEKVQLAFLETGMVLRFDEIEWVEPRKFYGRGGNGCMMKDRFDGWYRSNPTGHAAALVLSNVQAFNGCADGLSYVARTCDPHVQTAVAVFRPDFLTQDRAAHLIAHELAHCLVGMRHLPLVPDGKRGIAGSGATNDLDWHEQTLRTAKEYVQKVDWCDTCEKETI